MNKEVQTLGQALHPQTAPVRASRSAPAPGTVLLRGRFGTQPANLFYLAPSSMRRRQHAR